jgi:hypothetical protein
MTKQQSLGQKLLKQKYWKQKLFEQKWNKWPGILPTFLFSVDSSNVKI